MGAESGPGGTAEGRTGDRFGGPGRGGAAFSGGFGSSGVGNRDGGPERALGGRRQGGNRIKIFQDWLAAGRPGSFREFMLANGSFPGGFGKKNKPVPVDNIDTTPTFSPFQYSLLGDPGLANTTSASLLG